MITDKDVADKKNEVTMLRLERDEMLIRRQLDRAKQKSELTNTSALREANETIHNAKTYIDDLEAELSNSKSTIVMKNGVINDRNETISDLRMAASDMLDTINECARGEAEDSRVLMQVVEVAKEWNSTLQSDLDSYKTMTQVYGIIKDYLAAPESPVVTLKTPRVEDKQQKGTINKLNALLADEKMTLAAYRNNPLSDQVADRDNRIEQLMVLNEALRIDMELAHNLSRDRIANQAGIIEGLRKDLDARNTVINDFKAIEQKETDRLHRIIDVKDKTVGKCLRSIDRHLQDKARLTGKLERIAKITKKARTFGDVINRVSANHIAIDEITKIIQEE